MTGTGIFKHQNDGREGRGMPIVALELVVDDEAEKLESELIQRTRLRVGYPTPGRVAFGGESVT
jgi:hypothetical protein